MTKNIAHRGFSGKYPENTLLAFEKALEEGVDGIEFDVHLSKDNELVIIHDETIDRTTNGTGRVCDYTYRELCGFDASAGFKGVYGIQKIPTLRDYFELIRGKDIVTNIELKTGIIWYQGIEAKTLAVIDEFNRRESTIISSFNHHSVVQFQQLAPDVKLAFLEESRLIHPAGYVKYQGVQCYHPLYHNMTDDVVSELKSAGVEINVWTVNDENDMLDMLEKKMNGVITNYPCRFNRVRKDFSEK